LPIQAKRSPYFRGDIGDDMPIKVNRASEALYFAGASRRQIQDDSFTTDPIRSQQLCQEFLTRVIIKSTLLLRLTLTCFPKSLPLKAGILS
jgi:hypothetical protein